MMSLPRAIAIALLALAAAAPAYAQPRGLLGAPEIQKLLDGGNQRQALREISRALSAVNPPEPVDRPELLLLRADCLLRTHAAMPALQAAHDAAADPGATRRQRARGLTLELLIRKSRGNDYTPLTPTTQPAAPTATAPARVPAPPAAPRRVRAAGIDISNPRTRPAALAALFSDEQATVLPTLDAALHGDKLDAILDALTPAADLTTLELGALGTEKTQATVDALKARALERAQADLDARVKSISDIEAHAMAWKTEDTERSVAGHTATVTHDRLYYRPGPTDQQVTVIHNIDQQCRDFARALARMATLGLDRAKLETMAKTNDELITRCDTMLLTNFAARYDERQAPHTYRLHGDKAPTLPEKPKSNGAQRLP